MLQSRFFGLGLIGLGVGAAASSLLGPLVAQVIKPRISGDMENQLLGGDIINLVLLAPTCVVAGVLWVRGNRLAPIVALGPAAYGLYTWPQYVLGPEYLRYPGNNEQFFPLYVGMTTLSWVIGAKAWSMIDTRKLPAIPHYLRRGLGGSMLLLGGLFALAWTQQISSVLAGEVLTEYEEHPGLFWLIKTLDFAFAIPLLLATGTGLLRNHPLAIKIAYGLSGFVVLQAGAVSAMGISMLVRNDPAATIVLPAITTPVTAIVGGLTAALYRAYLSGGRVAQAQALPSTRQSRRSRFRPGF